MPAPVIAQILPSSVHMYAFRLKPGDDLKLEIEKIVKAHNWQAVSIVSCVGSLNAATIRFADKKEGTVVAGKLEIVSLTGTLSPAGCHLHIAVSDSAGKTIGGHLLAGSSIYTTAEIVIAILKDYKFERETDNTFGYKELLVTPLIKK